MKLAKSFRIKRENITLKESQLPSITQFISNKHDASKKNNVRWPGEIYTVHTQYSPQVWSACN